MLISHVFIGTSHFDRSFAFYQAVLPILGIALKLVEPYRQWSVWSQAGGARPFLIVGRPYDGGPAVPGNGNMVALAAANRSEIDAAYAAAIAAGAGCDGPPGLRAEYHPHYYGCYLRDPDGNKIAFCCHGEE